MEARIAETLNELEARVARLEHIVNHPMYVLNNFRETTHCCHNWHKLPDAEFYCKLPAGHTGTHGWWQTEASFIIRWENK